MKIDFDFSKFEEFLLAKDEDTKEMGFAMLVNSFDFESMSLDELNIFRVAIIRKYYGDFKIGYWRATLTERILNNLYKFTFLQIYESNERLRLNFKYK